MNTNQSTQIPEDCQEGTPANVLSECKGHGPKSPNEMIVSITLDDLAPHLRVLRPSRASRVYDRME